MSVTLFEIHMIRTERDVVIELKPIFYRKSVVDIYNQRKKMSWLTISKLNSYHPNIKLTVESNPNEFVDYNYWKSRALSITVRQIKKLPVPWDSNIPKSYERNIINTELHHAKKIASNFKEEILLFKRKFIVVDYPVKFTEIYRIVLEYIIPPNLMEVPKSVIFFEITFRPKNETSSKQFTKTFHQFRNNTFDVRIKWPARKIRTLFQLKDKSLHIRGNM